MRTNISRLNNTLFAVLVLCIVSSSAKADNNDAGQISFSLGYYDVSGNNEAADFRIEYRAANSLFAENLKPWVSLELTSEASTWLGAGVLYDWEFKNSWHLMPSIGVGVYSQGSSDLDLGNTIVFRSQIELEKELNQNNIIGASFSHLSNAGLDSHNPGVEVLNLYWHRKF